MQKKDLFWEASGCVAHCVSSTPVPPKGVLEFPKYPLSTPTMGLPPPHFVMAAGPVPPGRLMRKHGDTVCRVYYGGMEDSKDVDYESDSAFSVSSAASSAAGSEEDHLREEQQAAETVRSPTFFSDVTFVRTYVHSTWQMRRSLKILDGAADETIDDLFSTMSEVEKMGRMEQTLLRMLSVIGARKTVVEEREAARHAQATAPAVQSTLTAS